MEFFQTGMGRRFYENTMPKLVRQLQDMTAELKRFNDNEEKKLRGEGKPVYNEIEHGICDVCGKEGDLTRTYFYYPIKCACCSPRHFELIRHHKECNPAESEHTKVEFKTEDLKVPASFASKVIEETGVISDGYHTFDELYFHRMMLFSVICNTYKDKAWKSKLHDDGTMYDNYFIVGITTPEGDYTYHYHMQHWDHFKNIKELPNAPKWDGHKPGDVGRLKSLFTKPVRQGRRYEDMEICRAFCAVYSDLSCAFCASKNVILTGVYSSDKYGFYVDIKCNACGYEGDYGDPEFWKHYKFVDGEFCRK